MKSRIAQAIYKIGINFYNVTIFKHYNFLKTSENWSYTELKEYQLKKMVELIKIAYHNSSYYREVYDFHNIDVESIKTIEDIKKLPHVTKEDLKNFNSKIHTGLCKKNKVSKTSGTSGQSLSFLRNLDWDGRSRAAIYRGLSWYGVNPWDRNGYLWGYNFKFIDRLKTYLEDLLQNRFRLFYLDSKNISSFIGELKKATYLSGYSSVIYELAKAINKGNRSEKFNLKLIKGTSEKILDKYHEEIYKAFGVKIISEYGSAETGIISFECPFGTQHVCMENVFIEKGEEGQIIVTNLMSYSFPIIRYELGDIVDFIEAPSNCSCGMEHHEILEIKGRIGSLIEGYSNNYPSLTLYYIFKNLSNEGIHLNYQGIQDKQGVLKLSIEQDVNAFDMQRLNKQIKNYFNEDVDVLINCNQNIKSVNGKQRDFISYL